MTETQQGKAKRLSKYVCNEIYNLIEEKEGENEKLEEQAEVNTALRWHNAQLEARLARIEKAILRERKPVSTQTD